MCIFVALIKDIGLTSTEKSDTAAALVFVDNAGRLICADDRAALDSCWRKVYGRLLVASCRPVRGAHRLAGMSPQEPVYDP